MKNRSVISIVIFMFVILGLFTTCAEDSNEEPEPDVDTGSGIPVPGSTLAEKLQWLTHNPYSGTYLLEVSKDESLDPSNHLYNLSYSSDRSNITIRLRGMGSVRINLLSNGSFFIIGDGVTLILDNITLQGLSKNNFSLIQVGSLDNSKGTLILEKGAKITGNGGCGVINLGTVIINGGEISNNASIFGNGFAGVNNLGTLTMNGGEISGNRGILSRGVNVYDGTFTMNGGKITGNGGNGGVSLDKSTFTMNGGEISDNGSLGVGMNGGTFTMNGGTISGNQGRGVSIGGTFAMSGGTISGNTDGGVSVGYSSTFTMSGGIITGNTLSLTDYMSGGGGGVYVSNNGTFTKSGGTITGYASDPMNGNVVKDISGVVSDKGHAVYYYDYYVENTSKVKHRETTAGPEDNMDSNVDGTAGGWEE